MRYLGQNPGQSELQGLISDHGNGSTMDQGKVHGTTQHTTIHWQHTDNIHTTHPTQRTQPTQHIRDNTQHIHTQHHTLILSFSLPFPTKGAFMTMMGRRLKTAEGEEELIEAFRVFDKDGKGVIASGELRHLLTNLGERLEQDQVNSMMQEIIPGAAGNLKYEPFIRYVMNQ